MRLNLYYEQAWMRNSDFLIRFRSSNVNLRDNFEVDFDRETNYGVLNIVGFGQHLRSSYPFPMNLMHSFNVPQGFAILISFPYFDVEDEYPVRSGFGGKTFVCHDYVELSTSSPDEPKLIVVWRRCGAQWINASLYQQPVYIRFYADSRFASDGFKLLFSFHNASMSAIQSADGSFNCSKHYDTFRQHVDCNLRQECQGGEDEHHGCPYNKADHDSLCDVGTVRIEVSCLKKTQPTN
jgi:hypothetical protein